MMFNYMDLFAGIGGFALGAQMANVPIEHHYFSEIDDYAQKIYQQHFPNAIALGDIRNIKGDELPRGEWILTGGFPCQSFSSAGKRRGKEDDRYIWEEMFRVIQKIRPRWIIGENVPGIVRMALDDVLSDLESADYSAQKFIIPACAVNAPHKRERVWIVANADSTSTENSIQARRNIIKSLSANEIIANPTGERLERQARESIQGGSARPLRGFGWQSFEPPLCGRNDGISNRVDRIKALGNAVVPQIPAMIFQAILKIEHETSRI